MGNVNLKPAASSIKVKGSNVNLKLRAGLSIHHLLAACRMAYRIHEIEEEHEGEGLGDFWSEIFQNSLGVAMMSVAALESFANELYFEGNTIKEYLNESAAADILRIVDREKILNKYSLVSSIRTDKRLNTGCGPAQKIARLIELRNAVVHFQPEWLGEDGKHQKLSAKLKHHFEQTPFLPEEQLFPRAWASYSFATWALESTIGFIDYFYETNNLNNPLNNFRDQLASISGGIV